MRENEPNLIFKLLLGIFLATGSATSAFAGANSSGGGPTIVTYDGGHVATASLLDLYEGQIRFGLSIPQSTAPAQQQIDLAMAKLTINFPTIASDVKDALTYIQSHESFLPLGVVMAPGIDLGDSYAALIPEGTQLQYVGYYEADGTLKISQTIYNKLSETDKAAFIMHEALYSTARLFSYADNSAGSRKFNAYLFSTTANISDLDVAGEMMWGGTFMGGGMDPTQILSGNAGTFTFKVTVQGNDTVTAKYGCSKKAITQTGHEEQAEYTHAVNGQDSWTMPEILSNGERCKAVWMYLVYTTSNIRLTQPAIEIDYGTQVLIQKSWDPIGLHSPSAAFPVYH
jgi:hypothetical protein